MKLQMHSIHFDADRKLLDFIQKKVNKLETFHDKIVNGEVILKLDNNEERENKIIEIKLFIPGNMLFAKEQAKTFEAAADIVVETMKRQLKKYKEKQVTH
jgi:putative sigma-54 modulation protein